METRENLKIQVNESDDVVDEAAVGPWRTFSERSDEFRARQYALLSQVRRAELMVEKIDQQLIIDRLIRVVPAYPLSFRANFLRSVDIPRGVAAPQVKPSVALSRKRLVHDYTSTIVDAVLSGAGIRRRVPRTAARRMREVLKTVKSNND